MLTPKHKPGLSTPVVFTPQPKQSELKTAFNVYNPYTAVRKKCEIPEDPKPFPKTKPTMTPLAELRKKPDEQCVAFELTPIT
jgi:hypothetical protein